MSNSKLVDYTKISPNSSNPRKSPISKITIHHVAGNVTVERLGETFARESRRASSNYGIGTDGRVGMYVEEANRSWCSSNAENDNMAITIEVANDGGSPDWHVSDKALAKLIDLCVDICQRNGIKKLNFTGDKNGNLTMHKYFVATACPGKYLESKFPYIAEEVNKRLEEKKEEKKVIYRVQVGAYSVKAKAEKMAEKLKADGYPAIIKQDTI
jgi:N-acetyl-anhydromuramyl-L-alanine amidase AmpD